MIKERINFHPFSIFITKMGLTLSALYFITAFVLQSTIQYSPDIVKTWTNIHNFTELGIINFLLYIVLGIIFNYKLQR